MRNQQLVASIIILLVLGTIFGAYTTSLFQVGLNGTGLETMSSPKQAKREHLQTSSEEDYSLGNDSRLHEPSEKDNSPVNEPIEMHLSPVINQSEEDYSLGNDTRLHEPSEKDNSPVNKPAEVDLSPVINPSEADSSLGNDTRLHLVKKFFPEIIRKFSHSFLKGYKEPCFKKGNSSKIFCLPYFYLASPPKCATTDVWFNIQRHPSIVKAKGGDSKEPHWWAGSDKSKNKVYVNYLKRQNSLIARVKKYPEKKSSLISGDGSCSTIFNLKQIRQRTKSETPPFTWGDVIHAVTPDVKVITILRNPVDRVISDYFAFAKSMNKDKSPQHFHENVIRGIGEINTCLQTQTLLACASASYSYPRLQISMYYPQVREWLRVFTRKQMLILRTEDWINRGKNSDILANMFTFLGIDAIAEDFLPQVAKSANRLISSKKASQKARVHGEILPESRELLKQFFEPFNQQLADVLQDDRFLWK